MGTATIASAPGKVIGVNRCAPSRGGVRPPWPYQAAPISAVRPAASMLTATPDTI
jgi:hypothetical protein